MNRPYATPGFAKNVQSRLPGSKGMVVNISIVAHLTPFKKREETISSGYLATFRSLLF